VARTWSTALAIDERSTTRAVEANDSMRRCLGSQVVRCRSFAASSRAWSGLRCGLVPAGSADDYPEGVDPSLAAADLLDGIVDKWGTASLMALWFGSIANEEGPRRALWAQAERLAMSPGALRKQFELLGMIDVRDVLPNVSVPVLVLHAEFDWVPLAQSRYLAEHVRDGRLVEMALGPLSMVQDTARSSELAEFFTGAPVDSPVDRVLRTVLFTDIVNSTGEATRLGDRCWRDGSTATTVRSAGTRSSGGVEVNTTGDGFLGVRRTQSCRDLRTSLRSARFRAVGVETRVGVHAGECEVRGADYAGIAVHIGARVCALAGPGEVLITSTVRDLIAGSGISLRDRGRHALKGVPSEWNVLAVEP
jgi:class 3 adenylate cyclase